MKFVLQMAARELRSSWKRLLFFFICIAIGVGSIVALRSMIRNANRAVAADARNLMTGDVRVDTDRPWNEETIQAIAKTAAPPAILARTETIESVTMLRPADPAKPGPIMIELKGIEKGFPLVGEFNLDDGKPFEYSLIENSGAVVSAGLLDRLDLQVGDGVKIGAAAFQIRGAFKQEPGAGGGFRLGPRVIIERSALEKAGLTGFGSRARRKILFTTAEDRMAKLTEDLRATLKNQLVNVRSYKDSEQNMNEQYTRAENYLSLTGLVILVLGGIGISNVTRVFVDQKRKTIAVLKCIGGTGGKITIVYLAQVMALGLAGSGLGVALARVTLSMVRRYWSQVLPQNMQYTLEPGAVAQGLGVGVLISLLFSALPLLRIRKIKPNVLLRDESNVARTRFDLAQLGAGAAVTIGVLVLVSWQAGSLRIGFFFLGGLAAAALTLFAAAAILISTMRRVRTVSSFAVRQALNSMYRPGNQTRVIVMVVGLGVFLVLSVQSIQANLVREFDIGRGGKRPNMFLIDIQKDQREGVADLVEKETGAKPVLVPTARARIIAINGQEGDQEQGGANRERGRLGREYVVTYRGALESNETVIAGKFWDSPPAADPEVSLEESMRGLGVDVGGNITFDIQGRKITAAVTSLRHVDWRNSQTGFMVLFRPGVLDNSPQMIIGAVDGPTEEIARSRFQRVLLDHYPNVSIIDVTEIMRNIERIANNITLAVTFIGLFVFLSGSLILIGSIAMTKFQRIYEAAVLKTLGAKRKTLVKIILTEYGLMGLVAGFIGSAFSIGLSYCASRYVFEIPWSYMPGVSVFGLAGTVLLVTGVGTISTFDVLAKKPLSILASSQ